MGSELVWGGGAQICCCCTELHARFGTFGHWMSFLMRPSQGFVPLHVCVFALHLNVSNTTLSSSSSNTVTRSLPDVYILLASVLLNSYLLA